MAKHFARIIVYGAQSVGRAFVKAVRQEIDASRAAANRHQTITIKCQSTDTAVKGMTLNEAQQILNVTDLSNMDEIRINYDHLFSINEKSNGGSFYIQSKVFRAKERLDRQLQNKEHENVIKDCQSVSKAATKANQS
ncbi:mitochondrial import inner membrane translocase subunit Tim16 [Drosophila grimshawi]|uniref:mitochondrial import inner membrane translocase subunit Tim16 n=1 Tax=Drosophila grimshawi TaxID=7222 RepID=UPI000C86EB8C|nr:mitochondrial import inner membrane translocase subunit Tim16 [Drosophila grimshawi]